MKIKTGLENSYAELRANNTKDPFGLGIINYAERWCNMMEERIAKGESVAEAAAKTEYAADTDLISGTMFRYSLNVLCQFWEHGEELREWYDSKYSIAEETDTQTNESETEEPVMEM